MIFPAKRGILGLKLVEFGRFWAFVATGFGVFCEKCSGNLAKIVDFVTLASLGEVSPFLNLPFVQFSLSRPAGAEVLPMTTGQFPPYGPVRLHEGGSCRANFFYGPYKQKRQIAFIGGMCG